MNKPTYSVVANMLDFTNGDLKKHPREVTDLHVGFGHLNEMGRKMLKRTGGSAGYCQVTVLLCRGIMST